MRFPSQAPPPHWMGNCVSGAVPACWSWLCNSADWQVRWQVTGKASRPEANENTERWGRVASLLPRQPPLNEHVHGIQPDDSYITGWRGGGARLWGWKNKREQRRKGFFFHWAWFIYITHLHFVVYHILSHQITSRCHLDCREKMDKTKRVQISFL